MAAPRVPFAGRVASRKDYIGLLDSCHCRLAGEAMASRVLICDTKQRKAPPGKLEVTEVFNFSQHDLLAEDMMILDTHFEVFIWMGQCVEPKETQKAFEIGQKYVEHAVAFEGIAPDLPLYKVTEGNEPCFFRTYFSRYNTQSVIHGNSFEKKLSVFLEYVRRVDVRVQVMVGQLKGHQHWQLFPSD